MTRYVIEPQGAIYLASKGIVIADKHQLLAPTLFRSQLLSELFRNVNNGKLTKKEADQYLNYVRGLRMRLLGDRVLQQVAWKIADQIGAEDTYLSEYIALTQLQADALISLNAKLSSVAKSLVELAPINALAQ